MFHKFLFMCAITNFLKLLKFTTEMLKVTLEVIIITLKELCKLRGLNSLPPCFSSTYVSPDHYIWQHISCVIFLLPLSFVCRKTLLLLCHSFFEQTWKFRCSEMCNMNVGSSGVKEKCNELERSQFGIYLKSNSI